MLPRKKTKKVKIVVAPRGLGTSPSKVKMMVAPRGLGTSPSKVKIVVVAGPTASGKSDLAIALARRFDGEVISADSRQVYRGMDIGTGKVPNDGRKKKNEKRAEISAPETTRFSSLATRYFSGGIRHWMLDVASPKRRYTVMQWRKAAKRAVTDIASRGKLPIVCGGTGFYIDSLIYHTTLPSVVPDTKLRAQLEKSSTAELFTRLERLDPRRAADIDPHNRRRLIRALEIVMKTGEPVPPRILIYQNPGYEVLYLGISVPMDELKERIEKRLDERLKAGMINEVRRLHAPPAGGGVSWNRLESFGLEYRHIAKYLRSEPTSLPTGQAGSTLKTTNSRNMREALLRDIIAYAKRQMTWWRKNSNIVWVKNQNEASRLVERFLKN